MNERNLKYIKKLNPKSSINLADNKIETKVFLEERGINVPKTLSIISNKKQLNSFNLKSIKEDFFVIKPVYGSKGNGILIVERLKNGRYKIGGEIVTIDFLNGHMQDILNGDFSINYAYDKVFIEEKLIPGNGFDRFCEYGLADIRIIVYNLVPVAAMVRIPTLMSSGKANLAQGGIGMGIEVGSGIINTLYINGKVYENKFPDDFQSLKGYEIPFWDEILLSSSKVQFFVNLGYLALDWVITKGGPKILEINARAGLEIQNVCLLPLKNRLEKIEDLKVTDPEKGVELSKSLFSEKLSDNIHSGTILYLSQDGKFIVDSIVEEVIVKVNLNNKVNFISKHLYAILENNFIIELQNNIKFSKLKFQVDELLDENVVVLGNNSVKDFFIKPENNTRKVDIFIPEKLNKNEISIMRIIDEKVGKIDKKISLTSILKPFNFFEELNKFIETKGKYNPIFEYDFPNNEKLKDLEDEILLVKNSYFKEGFEFKSGFSKLFLDKLDELDIKLKLIKAYKEQDFVKINKYNILLFGDIDNQFLKLSEKKSSILFNKNDLGKQLDLNYVFNYINDYLVKNGLSNYVKVVLSSSNIARISLNRKKGNIEIRVSVDGVFREKELDGVIAHEIGVHLIRYLNGKKTGWNILESGTANYITTEEGLAVYNSLKYFPDSYDKNSMYQNYYMIHMAKKLNFQELAEIGFKFKGNDYVKVFKTITRFKKGIIDTSVKNSGAFYSKDKVYVDGFIKVKNWLKEGGNLEKLMIGKIKIEDLDFIY